MCNYIISKNILGLDHVALLGDIEMFLQLLKTQSVVKELLFNQANRWLWNQASWWFYF